MSDKDKSPFEDGYIDPGLVGFIAFCHEEGVNIDWDDITRNISIHGQVDGKAVFILMTYGEVCMFLKTLLEKGASSPCTPGKSVIDK